MITQWNDDEDAALQGLPHFAQLLYLRVLRRYMDYRDGVVGLRRRISYQMIRETLAVERDRGSRTRDDEHVSQKKIRVAMDQLTKAGLVQWPQAREKFSAMVMRLPMASIDPNFCEGSADIGEICLQEEGHEKGMEGRARVGRGENVVFMRSRAGFPQAGGAREGHGRKGIPPDLRIDRQIDARSSPSYPQPAVSSETGGKAPDEVPALGEAIAMLVDAGVRSSAATSVDHRLLLADLLQAGATRAMLAEAIRKAQQAKQGRPWSVFYLEPIVRELLSPSTTNEAARPGGSHAAHQLRRKSGAGFIAQGFEQHCQGTAEGEEG